jgi:hypothetical protein
MRTCLWTAAFVLVPALSMAGPPAASGSAAPATAKSGAPAAAGSAKPFQETPEQRERRFKYVRETAAKTREIIRKDNKAFTKDEGILINNHWRTAMRGLRIKDLAEDDNEPKVVGRVDAAMKRIDDRFFTKLGDLNAKAPPRPPSPVITSPAANANEPLTGAFTFKFKPEANVVKRFCSLVQAQGHEFHHWSETVKGADECTLGTDKPQHAKFTPGKAHFHAWLMVGDNWSDMTSETIELTGAGGAAPVASGGAK